jgi:two-component system chemotaxis response regulator CheB
VSATNDRSVRAPRRIVVIGASAGGIPALTRLMKTLDRDLDASVLVVLHLSPHAHSVLPDILARAGRLPSAHPRDREPLVAGQVYVAPPDRHLLINDALVRVTAGPWENGHRPSVDVLFRSAALWHGPRVIAIVLSGALDDGAAGVGVVAQHGGAVLVQDPDEAEVPDMPRQALATVPDAMVGSVDDIAELVNKLTREAPAVTPRPDLDSSLAEELRIAEGERRPPTEYDAEPAGLVCPDCSGALFEVPHDRVLRYRCRVGHAWTADALSNAHGRQLEETLWMVLRVLEDDVALQSRLESRARAHNRNRTAAHHESLREEREQLVQVVRAALGEAAAEGEQASP